MTDKVSRVGGRFVAAAPAADIEAARVVASATGHVVWLDSGANSLDSPLRSMVAVRTSPRAVLTQAVDGDRVWAALDDAHARDSAQCPHPDLGWVGYVAYEAGVLADAGLVSQSVDDPVIVAASVDAAWVSDDRGARWVAGADTEEGALALLNEVREAAFAAELPPPPAPLVMQAPKSERWHATAVAHVLDQIVAGRVYQACLTFPLLFSPQADLLPHYLALREASPGAYGAYLRLPGVEAASTSPERFLHIDGRLVRSRPMKGTRPRGATLEEDAALCEQLLDSEKDRAENIMIVDLMRNDLGRVCEIGSVTVPELFAVETYATVHHMTSTVEGRLRAEVGPFECLKASFPPGSMTGAPKIAACEILDHLEHGPRGLYAGTVFRLGFDGRHDFSVVIRTLQNRSGETRWDIGGGIVADSSAADEWDEAMAKANALRAAGLLR